MERDWGWQAPGGNWEGLFMPTLVDETFDAFNLVRPPTVETTTAESFPIREVRSVAVERRQRSRPHQKAFKASVLAAYGAQCGACEVSDPRLLDAAHIVDEGFAEDRWDNGLPLCPNHHRLFDRGLLRLQSDLSWTAESLFKETVSRWDLQHLRATPHTDAVRWKLAASHP
jgi:hypothetical protein